MRRFDPDLLPPTAGQPSGLVLPLQNLTSVVDDMREVCRHLNALTAIGTRLTPPLTLAEAVGLGSRFVEGLSTAYITHLEDAMKDVALLVAERPNTPESRENLTQLRHCMRDFNETMQRLPGFPADLAARLRQSTARLDAIPLD